MLSITEQELKYIAKEKGYRPEILEKVYRLLDLLETFMSVDFLKDRLALKGGTALNLFCAEQLPRLSLDLDFNYIGAVDRQIMVQDRVEIDRLIVELCRLQGYTIERNPKAHAGGKMVLKSSGLVRDTSELELDINYLYRAPLWDPTWLYSAKWPKPVGVSVLDIHELAAGKLHALLDRDVARDLFDSHRLLTQWPLDDAKLRLAFTVYAGMQKTKWFDMSVDQIVCDVQDVRNKLIPVLQHSLIPGTKSKEIQVWAEQLASECKISMQKVLPFSEAEKAFLVALDTKGEVLPELLSTDQDFCKRVKSHPLLQWRILQNGKV